MMKKILKKMTYYILGILLVLAVIVISYLQLPLFGKAPTGDRLAKMEASKNYQNGSFQNLEHTPSIAEGYTMFDVLKSFLFEKTEATTPDDTIPNVACNFEELPNDKDLYVWMGHSSYYLQVAGYRLLVDPVLSGSASPIAGSVKAFPGSNNISAEQLPDIDFLIISHDHYDHLDYETIKALKNKVKKIICPLGVGEHFEYWGYCADSIIEGDWGDHFQLNNELQITFTPARHFSGRTFKRNNTLWSSYVLQSPDKKLFLGGDSGYGQHFKNIGATYGPFDWVILENGQYNPQWHNIHALPEEQTAIIKDLNAAKVITVHHAKFKLASHSWKEPLEKIYENTQKENIYLATPKIGEVLLLSDSNQIFEPWWQ